MARFVLRRCLQALPTLFLISIVVFPLMRLAPGYPAGMSLPPPALAMPSFWLGLAMILVFSVVLPWLPPGGFVPFTTSPLENLQRLILPSVTLGVFLGATLLRFLRADMIEALGTDYVRTARAKGLANQRVVLGHALHNALIPVLTYAGIEVGSLLG